MRRVVFTSCVSAAVSHDRSVRNVVGGESWNLFDFEDAWGPLTEDEQGSSKVPAVLASAKMQAEQAVWKWVTEKRPGFVVNSGSPPFFLGSPLFAYLMLTDTQYFPTPSGAHLSRRHFLKASLPPPSLSFEISSTQVGPGTIAFQAAATS